VGMCNSSTCLPRISVHPARDHFSKAFLFTIKLEWEGSGKEAGAGRVWECSWSEKGLGRRLERESLGMRLEWKGSGKEATCMCCISVKPLSLTIPLPVSCVLFGSP